MRLTKRLFRKTHFCEGLWKDARFGTAEVTEIGGSRGVVTLQSKYGYAGGADQPRAKAAVTLPSVCRHPNMVNWKIIIDTEPSKGKIWAIYLRIITPASETRLRLPLTSKDIEDMESKAVVMRLTERRNGRLYHS